MVNRKQFFSGWTHTVKYPNSFHFLKVFAESDYFVPYPLQHDSKDALVQEKTGDFTEEYPDAADVDGDIPIHTAVRFELFTRENQDAPQLLSPNNDSLLDTNYDPNRPTRMFIHGWNSQGKLTPRFTEAYFKKGNLNVNVIAVNWRDLSDDDYVGARRRIDAVGSYVAQFIDYLVNRGNLKLKDFVLIGHSLGAHAAGIGM